MLVLTRRVGEAILIDGNIRIAVVSLRGKQVRLGIEAPSSVAIHREEIHGRSGQKPTDPSSPSGSNGPPGPAS